MYQGKLENKMVNGVVTPYNDSILSSIHLEPG